VALTPGAIPALTKKNLEVLIESDAGLAAGFADAEFQHKGARIVLDRAQVFAEAQVILQVRTLGANPEKGLDDLPRLHSGQVLIGMCEPLTAAQELKHLTEHGVTVFSLEFMPRITRAQSMDVLSSQATIAGYKAVLLAASHLPRMFPMLMTAAGTTAAARVFVVGAGVAGLEAIATAHRLGAAVEAYDVRPAVKEEIRSVGGKFVEFGLEFASSQDKDGYAKAMGEEYYRKQREMMARVVAASDVVITTAAVFGKKAPILLTAQMVHGMAPGSVVLDLAAERGGNCELTKPGETIVEQGVLVMGPLNLPATVPFHASQMYGKNISNFLLHLLRDGQFRFDDDDEITRETLVVHNNKVVNQLVRDALARWSWEQEQ